MKLFEEVRLLVIKDIQLELKQKYAINGILLYTVSTIFLCSLAFGGIIDLNTWNALFWVILLFAAVNAVSKSFVQENEARHYYYYSLAGARSIILAKMAYNILLITLLSILFTIVFNLFLGDFVQDHPLFYSCIFLGGTGFATLFTMISAIASRTNNNFALLAVLGFPVILPLLTLVIRISKAAITNNHTPGQFQDIFALAGIIIITVIMSVVLFPYLWRD